MNEWIIARCSTIIFEKESLSKKCVKMTTRIHESESYTALKSVDRRYYDLMLAIFMFALYDYMSIGSLTGNVHTKDTLVDISNKAKEWICDFDSLWFVGFPDMSGSELIRYIDSDWEKFASARMAVKSYFQTRCRMMKGEK